MPVLQSDIKDNLTASIYFQLALDVDPDWLDTETYAIGDQVRVFTTELFRDASVWISYKSLTANTDSNPLENPTDWEEYSQITEKMIEKARIDVEAYVIGLKKDYDEDNKFQKEAIISIASGYLIDSNNQTVNADDEQSPGLDERKRGFQILDNVFGLKTDDSPRQSPFAYVGNSNATVRTLAETDPNGYYNKNYTTNDLGK